MGLELIGALANQGGNMASNFFNFLSSQLVGRQERDFTREMYDKSFSDQLKMWHMNNDYNTPKAQRERLMNAGFNPALMYGKSGSTGTSGSPSEGGKVSQSSFPLFQYQQGMSILEKMYDLKAKKAQADILKGDAYLKDIDTEVAGQLIYDKTQAQRGKYRKDVNEGKKSYIELKNLNKYLQNRAEKEAMEAELRKMERNFFKASKAMRYLGILGGTFRNFK